MMGGYSKSSFPDYKPMPFDNSTPQHYRYHRSDARSGAREEHLQREHVANKDFK